jgi:hypothetical protein
LRGQLTPFADAFAGHGGDRRPVQDPQHHGPDPRRRVAGIGAVSVAALGAQERDAADNTAVLEICTNGCRLSSPSTVEY